MAWPWYWYPIKNNGLCPSLVLKRKYWPWTVSMPRLNKLQVNRPPISDIIVYVSAGEQFSIKTKWCVITQNSLILMARFTASRQKRVVLSTSFNFDALDSRFENIPVDCLQPVGERVDWTVRDPRLLQHHDRAESARLQIHYRSYCGFFLRKISI